MEVLIPMLLYDASGRAQYVYVPSKLYGTPGAAASPTPTPTGAPGAPAPSAGAAPVVEMDPRRLAGFGLHPLPPAVGPTTGGPPHSPAPTPQPLPLAPVPPVPAVTVAPPIPPTGPQLHVANMPPSMTVDKLKRICGAYGAVVNCRLAKKPPKDRLVGFVQFAQAEMARRALLALDGMSVDGWRLAVRAAQPNLDHGAAPYPSSNVYVANLPSDCTDAKLRDLFSPYGHVLSLVVFKDMNTGLCKGSGMVRFSTIAEASAAIEGLHRQQPPGVYRPLEVKYAENKSEKNHPPQPRDNLAAPAAPPSPALQDAAASGAGGSPVPPPPGRKAPIQPPSKAPADSRPPAPVLNLRDLEPSMDIVLQLARRLKDSEASPTSPYPEKRRHSGCRPESLWGPFDGFGSWRPEPEDCTSPEDSLGPPSSDGSSAKASGN